MAEYLLTPELLARGGAKLEATRLIEEQQKAGKPAFADIPVPHSVYLYDGQTIEDIKPQLESMSGPLIVRSSNSADLRWAIGTFETKRSINSFEDLEGAIRMIRDRHKAHEANTKAHIEDFGMQYDPKVHFLIQEQCPPLVCIVMRHPNRPWQLLVEWWDNGIQYSVTGSASYTSVKSVPEEKRLDMDGPIYEKSGDLSLTVTNAEIMDVIKMFLQFESANIVDRSYSLIMEAGIRPLKFYQPKLFKKLDAEFDPDIREFNFEARAEHYHHFTLPSFGGVTCINSAYNLAFGNTPPEGINVPLVIVNQQIDTHTVYHESRQTPYGVVALDEVKKIHGSLPRLGKLEVLCLVDDLTQLTQGKVHRFLKHDSYRLMAKAGVAIIADSLFVLPQRYAEKAQLAERLRQEFQDGARCYASGGEAIIVPEKYVHQT